MSLREDAKKLYSSSLAKLDPSGAVFDYLSSNKIVSSNYKKIYPVAFGKASISMMTGFLDYLSKEFPGLPIHEKPIVVSNISNEKINYNVDLHFTSHPIPDKKSIQAGDKVINYISSSTDNDLVVFLISGGASALLSKPPSSITLDDKTILTDLLLKSGASINEMNTVRKHMSDIKGGRLAKFASPSTCYSLIISDVINDDISWRERLEKSVLNIPLPVSAILSEPSVSLSNLVQFKEGDVMNLPPVDGVDFYINDKMLFKAEIGETNGQVAISLKNRL